MKSENIGGSPASGRSECPPVVYQDALSMNHWPRAISRPWM
jgi:hypothetical protein